MQKQEKAIAEECKSGRFQITDWQDLQRVFLGGIGAFLFVYQIMGYDLDLLLNRIGRAGSGALIVWAVFVKEPPKND